MSIIGILITIIVVLSILLIIAIIIIRKLLNELSNSNRQLRWYNMSSRYHWFWTIIKIIIWLTLRASTSVEVFLIYKEKIHLKCLKY